jgi:hypothetical protein
MHREHAGVQSMHLPLLTAELYVIPVARRPVHGKRVEATWYELQDEYHLCDALTTLSRMARSIRC